MAPDEKPTPNWKGQELEKLQKDMEVEAWNAAILLKYVLTALET